MEAAIRRCKTNITALHDSNIHSLTEGPIFYCEKFVIMHGMRLARSCAARKNTQDVENRGNRVTSRSTLPILTLALLLAACVSPQQRAQAAAPPPSWTFYDQCAPQTSSFVAMAQCGKANRNAYCQLRNICSAAGSAFVLYTDSLAASVQNHEITEAKAQRKCVEFRMAQANAAQAEQRREDQRISEQMNALGRALVPTRPAPTYTGPSHCDTMYMGPMAQTNCY